MGGRNKVAERRILPPLKQLRMAIVGGI